MENISECTQHNTMKPLLAALPFFLLRNTQYMDFLFKVILNLKFNTGGAMAYLKLLFNRVKNVKK